MRYTVKPQQVCSTSLSFDLEGDVVTNVEFVRGCDGNLKAISKLVDGMTVDKLESGKYLWKKKYFLCGSVSDCCSGKI